MGELRCVAPYPWAVTAVALLIAGLIALLAGAELLTRAGARVAAGLRIPPIVIGLTIVSIGTSAPELAVGVQAARSGVGDLAVGNIAGTNVVNLLLILGLSALIRPVVLHARTLRWDVPMMALTAIAFLGLTLDGRLTAADGAILLAIALVYSVLIVLASQRETALVLAEYAEENPPPRREFGAVMLLQLAALLAGVVVVVLGAEWLVRGAVVVAAQLGISDAVIGLTIVAIGTSAPELATSVVSTIRDRHRDIAVGNLVGSTVYNISLILGASALAGGDALTLEPPLVQVDIPIMTLAVLACVPVFVTGRRVSRVEGGLFVVAYLAYVAYLIAART